MTRKILSTDHFSKTRRNSSTTTYVHRKSLQNSSIVRLFQVDLVLGGGRPPQTTCRISPPSLLKAAGKKAKGYSVFLRSPNDMI